MQIKSLSAALLLATGCALKQEIPRNSRYFADYSDFQKVEFAQDTRVYRHPTTRITDYAKFMLGEVTVYTQPLKKISPAYRPLYDQLEVELSKKLSELTSAGYKLVDEPGPGVLKLEYAIVDIKPYVWLTKPDGTRYFRTDTTLKGSKFELDCLDSLSDERIFAISTLYPGEIYRAAENPSLIPNLRQAFDDWSALLSRLLIQAREKRHEDAAKDRAVFRPSEALYQPDAKDPTVQIYRHPSLHPLSYERFFIAIPHIEGQAGSSSQENRMKAIKLRERAAAVFKNDFKLVNAPGPGVLTVRTRIDESHLGYKFSLECIDPNQGELVFGLIRNFPPMDIDDAYEIWNDLLKKRLEAAKDNPK